MADQFAKDQNLVTTYLERFSSENTRSAYQNDLSHFFAVLGTTRPALEAVQTIEPADVNHWIKALEKEYHPSTVARRISAVKGFFEWLIAQGVLTSNPAHAYVIRRATTVRTTDRPILALTAPQAKRLIEAADNPRDYALVVTLLYCMLRRSEIVTMDVDHLQESQGHPILLLPATKGGAGQFVKIPEPAYEAIQYYLDRENISHGPIWRSMSNRNRGDRITDKTVYNVVVSLSVRSGLFKIYPHILRHTGCTLAIEAGASVPEVQAHARHRSINTTMGYVHQRNRLDKSAGDYIKLS